MYEFFNKNFQNNKLLYTSKKKKDHDPLVST